MKYGRDQNKDMKRPDNEQPDEEVDMLTNLAGEWTMSKFDINQYLVRVLVNAVFSDIYSLILNWYFSFIFQCLSSLVIWPSIVVYESNGLTPNV